MEFNSLQTTSNSNSSATAPVSVSFSVPDLSTTQPVYQAASSSLITSSPSISSDRTLRSNTRAKAKDKDRDESIDESSSSAPRSVKAPRLIPSTSNTATPRRAHESAKGKGKEVSSVDAPAVRSSKRTRRATLPPTASALIINEPVRDLKGKKRAAPESLSEDETVTTSTTNKKPRSAPAYSLRSRKDSQIPMPKKSRLGPPKPKLPGAKSRLMSGPSRSEDNEDMDVDYPDDMRNLDDLPQGACDGDGDDDDEREDGDPSAEAHPSNDPPEHEMAATSTGAEGNLRTMEELAGLSMFSDFGRIGGYMSQLNARLRTLLSNIKPQADPTIRLLSLQELSELLSISTEDTLAGSFQVESFVRELVRILGGSGFGIHDDGDGDDDDDPTDDDAALAAALQMSTEGGMGAISGGDDNLEAQLLACRCLANLMEALPGCGHTLVYHGAIKVLCSKLLEISYIDLAEQTLITLEKISEEYPSAIVREGGLGALLNYLDFFSIVVQRTALQAASNCCRNASADSFPMIKDVWPIIRNCLGYADQRLVDYAALCVIRVVDSYHRAHVDKLEALVDVELIRAVNLLLLPAGGSTLIPPTTFALLIRCLATAARASPKITISLLEAEIVTTLYQILTGIPPPQVNSEGILLSVVPEMAVMQNLTHRPKDQVEETLTLISELMPPLPKDGIFDHRAYSEKAFHRMVKAKAKLDRTSTRSSNTNLQLNSLVSNVSSAAPSRSETPINNGPATPVDEDPPANLPPTEAMATLADLPVPVPPPAAVKEPVAERSELLHSKAALVNQFLHLMVPILVDVYSASVSVPVRIKSLTSILKAISFVDAVQLQLTLKSVPIASFASSILSSNDHPNLMIGGLQMIELILSKAAAEFKPSFRREGVLHEIDTLAARQLTSKAKEKEKKKEIPKEPEAPTPNPTEPAPPAPFPPSSSKRPHLIDPEDAYTLRARVIKFKYMTTDQQADGDATFASLRYVVEGFGKEAATEAELRQTARSLSSLFSCHQTSVSSFELLQSGLVDTLLEFATSDKGIVSRSQKEIILLEELFPAPVKGNVLGIPPFAVLVKKLQESLTRMESFEVSTVTPGLEDSKRNSPSLLARQIRLRLVAEEGSDTPRGCNNIIVSIHAIATFQALNDYLRPRLSGILSAGGPRHSSLLAAFGARSYGLLQPPGGHDSELPPPTPSTTTTESKPERRRSLRLSAKASAASLAEQAKSGGTLPPPSSASIASSSTIAASLQMPPEIAPSETVVNDDDMNEDLMDADLDADVFDDELRNDDAVVERTVMLSVADDGSKVEANTPHGTRVATPNPNKEGPPTPQQASPSKPSYAAALRNKNSDWHLQFSMDEQSLPLDMTVYGAVHHHEARKTTGPPVPLNLIWQGVYTVKYKKVLGPAPEVVRPDAVDAASRARSPLPGHPSLPDDAPSAKILRLLRVLHRLNARVVDNALDILQSGLLDTSFINNKLTAKLTRQLEEPMIVASSCLPDWAIDLPVNYPFLFPFNTRFSFLQSTSFGYARLILKLQSQQNRTQDSNRRDDTFGFLGRLQRQKVRISRKHILESAFKVFELYGSSSSILEVEYFDEVGTGLGPTLEFYSLVSKEFARRDLKIWRDDDVSNPGPYVHHPHGLFPSPLGSQDIGNESGQKRAQVFKVVGQFVAKAMLDSRIIDMSFNKAFLRMILGEELPSTLATLKLVDPGLAESLAKLQTYIPSEGPDQNNSPMKVNIEDLALDFTIPGYDIELIPNGKDIAVTSSNARDYIQRVICSVVGKGIELQAKSFREGFSKVFPVADLQTFSADELVMLFGSADEDWSVETLSEALKADHGFNVESRAIRNLLEVMAQYDKPNRRAFLQFITGSPKLPIGGFRALNPPLTVVRKPHEAPLTADDYLPSVMTCVNYLKLPEYSSVTVLQEKLRVAMKEGVGSFHLS